MKIGRQAHRASAISTSNEATILVRGRDLCSELRQRVEAFDVCHLVNEHESPAFFRPLFRVRREEHGRINDAPRHGDTKTVAVEQSQRAVDSQSSRHALSEGQPGAIDDARSFTRQLAHAYRTKGEPKEHENRSGDPEYGKKRKATDARSGNGGRRKPPGRVRWH